MTPRNVADYFLAQVDEDCGDAISNLKLQKLVYYAQGFHLAIIGEALFNDAIMAWEHGPVVPALYGEFKDFGAAPIPKPINLDFSIFTCAVREILDDIYSVFGQFSPWKLRNMTHEEPPWKDTPLNCEISHEAMRAYFTTQLTD